MPEHGGLTAVRAKGAAAETKAKGGAKTFPSPDATAGFVRDYLQRSLKVQETLPLAEMAQLIEILHTAREERRQVFLCGNGGSASTASHLAAWLGKDGSKGGTHRFRVVSLTDNIPWITSLANDEEYAAVFVEQLKNYGQPDDVLIAFSGSGNSPNVIRAIEWANERGILTVGITGRPGGKLGQLAKLPIFVESEHLGHVEEGHFLIQHLVSYFFVEMG
jgi:D-sedoheptulose 7-phosphate isomerase